VCVCVPVCAYARMFVCLCVRFCGNSVLLRVGLNWKYSIIHDPFSSWKHLSWIRMGTLELCPVWDIYGERRNLSEDYGREKIFLVIVKFHKMSTNVQEISKLGRFQ